MSTFGLLKIVRRLASVLSKSFAHAAWEINKTATGRVPNKPVLLTGLEYCGASLGCHLIKCKY